MVTWDNILRSTKFFFWVTISPREYDILDTNRSTKNSEEWLLPTNIPDFRAEMHRRNPVSSAASTPSRHPRGEYPTLPAFQSKIPTEKTLNPQETSEYRRAEFKICTDPCGHDCIERITHNKSSRKRKSADEKEDVPSTSQTVNPSKKLKNTDDSKTLNHVKIVFQHNTTITNNAISLASKYEDLVETFTTLDLWNNETATTALTNAYKLSFQAQQIAHPVTTAMDNYVTQAFNNVRDIQEQNKGNCLCCLSPKIFSTSKIIFF